MRTKWSIKYSTLETICVPRQRKSLKGCASKCLYFSQGDGIFIHLTDFLFVSNVCKMNTRFWGNTTEVRKKPTLSDDGTHSEMGTAFHLVSSNP